MPSPRTRSGARAAFTLVEMLVSVAIIGLLSALLIPAIASVQTGASKTVATSNLRQLANAMLAYVSDNDNVLPGPLNTGQSPRYSKTLTDGLGYKLWPYVSLPAPTDTDQNFPLLNSPMYLKYRQATTSPSFVMNKNRDGLPCNPWGEEGTTQDPMRLAIVMSQLQGTNNSAANTWAMQEVDQANVFKATGTVPGWKSRLPVKPVHGSTRITMFFDWHVQPVPVN